MTLLHEAQSEIEQQAAELERLRLALGQIATAAAEEAQKRDGSDDVLMYIIDTVQTVMLPEQITGYGSVIAERVDLVDKLKAAQTELDQQRRVNALLAITHNERNDDD